MTETPNACERVWEVEAAHDGRLGREDRASLDRHVEHCADCAVTRARLGSVREVARAVPRATLPPLAARRVRGALLRDAARPGSLAGVDRPRVLALAVAAALLVTGASVAALRPWQARPARGGGPSQALAEVTAEGAAVWSREVSVTREAVTLAAGSLEVRVPAQRAGHRFVLRVPDGEVEVRGTRLRLRVEGGRLRRVDVIEGVVAVRVAGAAEAIVPAGTVWQTATVSIEPVVDAPVEDVATATATGAPRTVRPAAMGVFARAVSALDRGHNGVAARGFAAFEDAHGDDPRAEDAAFLRVVALRRAGRMTEVVAAARRYLARYPGGLRRHEAEALMAGAGAGARR